jgi:hypothetical protein
LDVIPGFGQYVTTLPAKARHELNLDHGSVTCPRFMTDQELADALAAFVDVVRARPARVHGNPVAPPDRVDAGSD